MTGPETDETAKTIVAPMPGLVVRVEVEVGQHVKAGQGVVVVEAMKMENELKAPGDGVIAEIRAKTGETVEKGAVLLVLE
jgi:biotin carboxyl carrier protein